MPLHMPEQGHVWTQQRIPQALSVKVPEPPQLSALAMYLAGDENPKPVIDGIETPCAPIESLVVEPA